MRSSFATVTSDEGVVVRSADVDGFTLAELRFPPGYVQDEFEPAVPYLACVLAGRLEKSFRLRRIQLDAACAVTMPAGATHGARFGPKGARIMIVRPSNPSNGVAGCLERLAELRGGGLAWLAWRLAGELRASDAAAPVAAEGLALLQQSEPAPLRAVGRGRECPGAGLERQAGRRVARNVDQRLHGEERADGDDER